MSSDETLADPQRSYRSIRACDGSTDIDQKKESIATDVFRL